MVKKLKEKSSEGEEEEENAPIQAPLAITQGQGEDQQEEEVEIVEGVKGEEASEAPIATKKKKRKAKAPVVNKPKKVAKPTQPTIPTTRASTRATTQKAKEVAKTKEKRASQASKGEESHKRLRRKNVAPTKFDGKKIESDDNNQFQVVIQSSSLDLDNLCENIRNNVDLFGFSHIEVDSLGKIEKNQVEEAVYAMMAISKKDLIELSNSIPKS